jgi:hypothetical protein
VAELGAAFSRRLDLDHTVVVTVTPARPGPWEVELDRARPGFQAVSARIDEIMTKGLAP